MTKRELRAAIRQINKEIERASGHELIALMEYRDNLLFILETK